MKEKEYETYIQEILYRPFDKRYIFYHESVIERMRSNVMRNMLEENIGIITSRQTQMEFKHVFISNEMVEFNLTGTAGRYGSGYLFPLYSYPTDTQKENLFNHNKREKEPNISPDIFEKLEKIYRRSPSPEETLYYIYGVFYSNIYRETYAEFLKIDFPRVPFTADENLFQAIGDLGKQLADLHLLKSPLLDIPIARYQGPGDNDRIDRIDYKENEQRIYINDDKYFEGISPKVWNYHIGGYQVLAKYLKNRKGRILEDQPQK